MLETQQGDVILFQINDGGEINVEKGIAEMSGGLATAAYLSLFGGNQDDDKRANNNLTWWANLNENNPIDQYRSETQNLLNNIAATSNNLLRLEEAARRDLAWLIEGSIASDISVVASIIAINRVELSIDIEAVGRESSFEFVANWRSTV